MNQLKLLKHEHKRSLKSQTYKLAQKGKHETRITGASDSILTGGNVLLLEYSISRSKTSDANIAKSV